MTKDSIAMVVARAWMIHISAIIVLKMDKGFAAIQVLSTLVSPSFEPFIFFVYKF